MSVKIRITMQVDDEYADPEHDMGVTEDAYLGISDVLAPFGDNVEIGRE
jgi:hypothetical protein